MSSDKFIHRHPIGGEPYRKGDKVDQGAQDPIQLALHETADPRTCGSCVYFERKEPWNFSCGGYCNIILPLHIEKKPYDLESKPPNWVDDNYGCSFHKHTGKAYITSKLVQP